MAKTSGDDDEAEIVVVSNSSVYLLKHTGAVKWGPVALPGGFGGPPTIADVDGDGRPRSASQAPTATSCSSTTARSSGCSRRATRPRTAPARRSSTSTATAPPRSSTPTSTSCASTAARRARCVHSLALGSGTTAELPPIADVDGDGHAEIVAIANQYLGGDAKQGVFVVGGAGDTWVSTRKLWNQHDYHVTNVNDDLSIRASSANC